MAYPIIPIEKIGYIEIGKRVIPAFGIDFVPSSVYKHIQQSSVVRTDMPTLKHTTLRLKPYIRALIEHLAEIEHRDLTNMIEVCVLEYAKKNNVRVPVVNGAISKEEADIANLNEETP